jgi:DNA-binding XRE family transcriptional regulator
MITNERQHRITRAEIRRFEDALASAASDAPGGIDPRIYAAMIEGLESQVADLRDQVRQYEALRNGEVRRRVISSLRDVPDALIEMRIVRHLTQKELAKRLGLSEQQVQRYERTRYAGASIERLQQVADALGLNFKNTLDYTSQSTKGQPRAGGRGRSIASRSEGGVSMAGRKTGNAAVSAAGKMSGSKTGTKAAKRAAASDLAQAGNKKVTGKKAASAAGKTLASKSAGKSAKRATASDLSQKARSKKK